MANDLFDEWSSGVQLVNPSNDFFQEISTELSNPQEFQVKPEQIPDSPVAPEVPNAVAPVPSQEPQTPPQEPVGPEIRSAKRGGTITLEKTTRGWKASLDTGIPNVASENFYAANKDELIFSICEGKLEANKAIHKLKKEKLLGGDEPATQSVPSVPKKVDPKLKQLTADDIYEIKNAFEQNPGEAFDIWIKKRFDLDPEQLATALKAAPRAEQIAENQRIKADIDEINAEFIGNNPDYAEKYSTPENAKLLVTRMAKAYLGRKIAKNTPQSVVDETIYELFSKGYWTAENLETAKDELLEGALLQQASTVRNVSEPTPSQQVTPAPAASPSEPEAPRIATKTGQPVGLGISAKTGTTVAVPEDKPLSDVDLQTMDLTKLKSLAALQLQMLKQGRQ